MENMNEYLPQIQIPDGYTIQDAYIDAFRGWKDEDIIKFILHCKNNNPDINDNIGIVPHMAQFTQDLIDALQQRDISARDLILFYRLEQLEKIK